MQQLATITGKRQMTIPAIIFQSLNLAEGQKVVVSREADFIKIVPALTLVKKLAGSINVPARFKGFSADQIVGMAKKEYFSV